MRRRASTRSLAHALCLGALGAVLAACGAEPAPASATSPTATATAAVTGAPPPPAAEGRRLRVLVTGFHDWEGLGEPPDLWRCRDNPSCRLLVGRATAETRPTRLEGPLVRRLREGAPDVAFTFRTLPVTWNAFADVPGGYDVIVNVGLGVYDRLDALQLERGAYNLRRGGDAAGTRVRAPIDPSASTTRPAPPTVAARLDALGGRRFEGYDLLVADAREGNAYLCNETHWHALGALGRVEGLQEVYFLHIPYADGDDYDRLAAGVGGVILALLGRG
jgi:hypothetical protein